VPGEKKKKAAIEAGFELPLTEVSQEHDGQKDVVA
jgi:hypothetical protein